MAMKAGVLVDVDGTLVDSNYHHTLAWSRALRDHGERVPLVSIHRSIGMGSTEMLHSLIGRDDDAITDSWRAHFNDLVPEIVPCPGAAELLRALHTRGLVVVLATSSPGDLIEVYRRTLDADDAIDDVVTSSDVDRAKPNPDVFAVALQKTGLPKERVIVIGDSVWDVEAAKRAGLSCVGLESGGVSHFELEAAGASAVFRDPSHLAAELARSPIGMLQT
jgi:HAD superfamily hydrolase (TIGR01509 family)